MSPGGGCAWSLGECNSLEKGLGRMRWRVVDSYSRWCLSLGCDQNAITGWPKHLFHKAPKAWKLKIKAPADSKSGESLLPGPWTAVSSLSSCKGESSLDLYKCTNSICKGSILITYSHVKGLAFWYHHLGVRISTYELGGPQTFIHKFALVPSPKSCPSCLHHILIHPNSSWSFHSFQHQL